MMGSDAPARKVLQAWRKVMGAHHQMDALKSPVGWLPVHQDQLRIQHSVMNMGEL